MVKLAAKSGSGTPKDITLDNVTEPATFDLVIDYLYNSKYELPSVASVEDISASFECHILLYNLADDLMMNDLKSLVLKSIRAWISITARSSRMVLSTVEILGLLEIAYPDAPIPPGQLENSGVDVNEKEKAVVEGDARPKVAQKLEIREVTSPSNPVQLLLAEFAASKFIELRQDKSVMHLLWQRHDILKDVLSYVSNGNPIKL